MANENNKELLDIATMSAESVEASSPSGEKGREEVTESLNNTEVTKDWSDEEESKLRWKYDIIFLTTISGHELTSFVPGLIPQSCHC
jgi:hypothetical protein